MKVTNVSRETLFEWYKNMRLCDNGGIARQYELNLYKVMTEVIRKMHRVDMFVRPDKPIRQYPKYIHIYDIIPQSIYQRGMEDFPEVLVTNDGFEFRTEWFDLDIHEYFETLRDDAIWETGDELDKLRTQFKQKEKEFYKLGTLVLDDDVLNGIKK